MDGQTKARTALEDDALWRAVTARDRRFDNRFVYCVATTGVYCRPSCPSRLANRENVRFYPTCQEAEVSGYRPCKRCSPNEAFSRDVAKIVRACRLIERADVPPTLGELARSAGLSPSHFQRAFRRIVGVSPKRYALAQKHGRVITLLSRSATVSDAIFDAGFNSSARFYESSSKILGMTPSKFRAGGADVELYFAIAQSSLGAILVAKSAKGVCAISLDDDPEILLRDFQQKFPHAHLIGGDREFERMVGQVISFIETPGTGLELPLDIRGTAFQQRVWKALCDIPLGATASYSEIAKSIGEPKAARAVARACAANSIALAVPCHRVLRTDGALSGYRWGIERKRALLQREARTAKNRK
jgi:AraC family transcriptional regulator of adaptative response/methylated-DNA-[protein]-cysteine methyltransferase